MKRTLVIGDIHGALKALQQAFERAGVTDDDDLIFLGDYCDGYPDVQPLIAYLIKLPNDKVFIRGNHDHWTIQWLKRRFDKMDEHHFRSGGQPTYASYWNGEHPRAEEHLKWLEETQKVFVDAQNRVYMHGGFVISPVTDPLETVMWDRSLLQKALSADPSSLHITVPFDPTVNKPVILNICKPWTKIFIGHTATTNWQTTDPIKAGNVIDLDTGCGWRGGKLTVMDADTEQYWQSDQVGTLYLDAIGR